MSDQGQIITTPPERSDDDILRGLKDRLEAIAKYCQVALLSSGTRLFIAELKNARLNQWKPIGELAECSYAFIKFQPWYPPAAPGSNVPVIDQRIHNTVEEVSERLTKALYEFHCALTSRNGALYVVVPQSKGPNGIPDGTWREIGCVAPAGIVPVIASMARPS